MPPICTAGVCAYIKLSPNALLMLMLMIKYLTIAQITIKNICALQLSKFELQQIISNLKKVSLELSLKGSGNRL
jgi:hypothetical protein